MTGTRSGPRELAESVGSVARELAGKVRRMVITRTTSALWQVAGHLLFDGSRETRDAELFGGVGFHARPKTGDETEAIVVFPGGAGNPIVIAVRQEGVRRLIAGDLADNETQIHNATTVVRIKANGTVEIRSSGGTASPVPTMADFAALRAWVNAHTHSGNGVAPTAPLAAAAVGTTVLKAQ